MEKLYVGKIVFFKDGKQLELPLSYSNLSDYNSKVKQSLFSREEAKFLSFQNGQKVGQGDAFDARMYKKVVGQGFSIIRVMPFVKNGQVVPGKNVVTTFVPEVVQDSDASNLSQYFRKLESHATENNFLEQFYVFDKGRYYYYENNNNHENDKSGVDTLELFLKYKRGTLSAKESNIMNRYFNFDMEDVFLSETDKLPISHKNAAVILISQKGKRYSATKKMEQHRLEAIEMIKNMSGHDIKDEEVDMLAKRYNLVIMRILKTDRNAVVIYCPEKITLPQINELIKCMNEFERINLMLKVEGKPEILPLIGGNQALETEYSESNGVDTIRKKAIEYGKRQKADIIGTGMNLVATSVNNITKYLGKLKKSLIPEEHPGR